MFNFVHLLFDINTPVMTARMKIDNLSASNRRFAKSIVTALPYVKLGYALMH